MQVGTGYPSIDRPWMKWYEVDGEVEIPNHSLYENIWQNNKDNLDGIALHYFGNKITYKKLFELIREAEKKLTGLKISKGDVVAFISLYTPEMIAIFYAINKIGAISAMVDPRTDPNSITKYLKKAEVKCAFVQDACSEVAEKIVKLMKLDSVVILSTAQYMGFPVKQLYKIKTSGKSSDSQFVEYEKIENGCSVIPADESQYTGDEPAAICYTGGTTGESKGVLLSNRNINAVVEQFRVHKNEIGRQEKWLTVSIPFIAYSLICNLHMPLSFGMQCYIELYDNEKLPRTVLKHKIHHVGATPEFYEQLLKNQVKDLSFIIMPSTGADKLSEKTYTEINQRLESCHCNWKVCNGYGMTEVGSGVCISHKGKTNKANSVGIPFINSIVSAFDIETGEEVKQGECGEICISGPSVMLGYVADEKATSEVIKNHNGRRWMHTGDIGYIDEDGCVFISGRMKRMIVKHDGFKVFPAFIEEKMLTCKGIDNCSCVAKNDEKHGRGQLPVVFYTLKNKSDNEQFVEKDLREIARKLLPEYSRPDDYRCVDELPRTHAGKIDYRKLEELV